jgi:hypothetical protein
LFLCIEKFKNSIRLDQFSPISIDICHDIGIVRNSDYESKIKISVLPAPSLVNSVKERIGGCKYIIGFLDEFQNLHGKAKSNDFNIEFINLYSTMKSNLFNSSNFSSGGLKNSMASVLCRFVPNLNRIYPSIEDETRFLNETGQIIGKINSLVEYDCSTRVEFHFEDIFGIIKSNWRE